MKRDMDLIRLLLLEIEAVPAGQLYRTSESTIAGYDGPTLEAHLRLLENAGFVTTFRIRSRSEAICTGLTWSGHEFLDAARSPSVWNTAKQRLSDGGLGFSVSLLRDLLLEVAKDQLGLG